MYYGYARVSTARQNDTSIEVQLEYLRKQAEILGEDFKPCSEKVSGKLFEERSVFIGLINNTKEGDILGIYDDSRFGRETGSNLDYLERLNVKGVKLHDAGRFIDYNSPLDKMIFTVGSAFATYQREIQLKKSKEGIEKKKCNGDWIMRGDLFGYDLTYVKGKPVVTINETQAYYIRYIYDEYSKGRSVYSISGEIQDTTFKETNFKMKPNSVRRILLKPIYMGYYIVDNIRELGEKKGKIKQKGSELNVYFTREELEKLLVKSNYYPAIIEPEKWWYIFEHFKTITKGRPQLYMHRTTPYELTGVLRTACCGVGMVHCFKREEGKTYSLIPYYCTSSKNPCCEHHEYRSLREDIIEGVFRASFFLTFLDPIETGMFYADKKALLNNSIEELTKQKNVVEDKIKEVDKGLNNLINLAVQGIDVSVFKDKMNELNVSKDKLKRELQNVEYALQSQEGDLEDLLLDSSEEIIERFIHSESEVRRDTYLKYCDAVMSGRSVTIIYHNGKKFVSHFSRYGYNPEKPVKFEMYLKDELQASGCIEPESCTVTFDHIEESDEFKKYVNDENDKLAKKASELLLQAKENTCVVERVPNNNRV